MENGEKIKMIQDIARLNAEIEFVKLQVSNHLPTSISKLDLLIDKNHSLVEKRLRGIENKLAYWSGGIIVGITVFEFIVKQFFN